jgi:replicative DNA helicase
MNERRPPYSIDAERGVVGCLLLRIALLSVVLDTGLDVADFYVPRWAAGYAAILALTRRGDAVDVLTVDAELASSQLRPTLEELSAAVAEVPSLGHAATYAKRVAEMGQLRRILAACIEIAESIYGDAAKQDVDAFIEATEAAIMSVCERPWHADGPVLLVDAARSSAEELRGRSARELLGVASGFVDLDRPLGGLRAGQLVVLGSRPSMGKSVLGLNIAEHAAASAGPVLLVSAEMSAVEQGLRSLARGGAPSDRLLGGLLGEADWVRLEDRLDQLAHLPVLIDDTSASLAAIRARARRQKSENGLALLIVDYAQLISPDGRHERREREVAAVTRGLKLLAGELGIPVIAICQLSRAVEYRADKRPLLADLRESGGIEADADVALLLWRPAVYDLSADPGLAEVVIAKHRNGPTGVVTLTWLPSRMQFVDAAPFEERS